LQNSFEYCDWVHYSLLIFTPSFPLIATISGFSQNSFEKRKDVACRFQTEFCANTFLLCPCLFRHFILNAPFSAYFFVSFCDDESFAKHGIKQFIREIT
jgi:hypothetical protein